MLREIDEGVEPRPLGRNARLREPENGERANEAREAKPPGMTSSGGRRDLADSIVRLVGDLIQESASEPPRLRPDTTTATRRWPSYRPSN